MLSVGAPRWQAGTSMNSTPAWQRGYKSAQRTPSGYGSSKNSSKPSEYVINQTLTIVPFKTLNRSSYLNFQYTFLWSAEYQDNLILEQWKKQWDNSAKRRRLDPPSPWTHFMHGGQQGGEAANAMNLSIVNWSLACLCMTDKKTNEIPPALEIVKQLKMYGGCITQESASVRSDQQPGGGPDFRTFTVAGEVDIFQVFKGIKKNGVDQGIAPGTRLYFALKPELVKYSHGEKTKTLFFYPNEGDAPLTVTYTKPVIWTLVPLTVELGERIDFVKEGLQIFAWHSAPDATSDKKEFVEHMINLRGYTWRVATARSYADPAKSTQLYIGNDFVTNTGELQRSAQMTVRLCYIGSQSIFCH